MIKASFGLSERGSVRSENQDAYVIDMTRRILAVADGLGGLPQGARASKLALDLILKHLADKPDEPLADVLAEVNRTARGIGYQLDAAGFGTTLTMARLPPGMGKIEIAHIGDSAAYLVRDGKAALLTVEHTVAARMVAEQWEEACEAIPPSAHHTLTQCIGQDAYIDPQVMEFAIHPGDRLFLLTDGATKPVSDAALRQSLQRPGSLESICNALTFLLEANGSPDNYTIAAAEF